MMKTYFIFDVFATSCQFQKQKLQYVMHHFAQLATLEIDQRGPLSSDTTPESNSKHDDALRLKSVCDGKVDDVDGVGAAVALQPARQGAAFHVDFCLAEVDAVETRVWANGDGEPPPFLGYSLDIIRTQKFTEGASIDRDVRRNRIAAEMSVLKSKQIKATMKSD